MGPEAPAPALFGAPGARELDQQSSGRREAQPTSGRRARGASRAGAHAAAKCHFATRQPAFDAGTNSAPGARHLVVPREVGVGRHDPRVTARAIPVADERKAGADPPVEVVHTREVRLRGWRRAEIEAVLDEAGFPRRQALGGFDEAPWDPSESRDLILVAR